MVPAQPPVLVLMGPTASGKSRLAIELAGALSCEILSVDSAMVYRGMDIGTAKPIAEERRGIPHHLIDILDPSERYSTAQFRDQALALMHSISQRGRLPLLTGGTMLYFNLLLHGIAPLPAADADTRRQIDQEARVAGWAGLHARLAEIDPISARRIHPNDPQRIQRALEVYRITGRTLTDVWREATVGRIPFSVIKLIVAPQNRAALHERIRRRFIGMIEQGFIEEVRTLYERGDLDDRLPSIRSVGYRQAWKYLNAEYDKAAMVERAIIATRQLAKRQLTWLRRETDALRYSSEDDGLAKRILRDVTPRLDSIR